MLGTVGGQQAVPARAGRATRLPPDSRIQCANSAFACIGCTNATGRSATARDLVAPHLDSVRFAHRKRDSDSLGLRGGPERHVGALNAHRSPQVGRHSWIGVTVAAMIRAGSIVIRVDDLASRRRSGWRLSTACLATARPTTTSCCSVRATVSARTSPSMPSDPTNRSRPGSTSTSNADDQAAEAARLIGLGGDRGPLGQATSGRD